jgi:Peptidase inhibitor family I36
MRGSTAVTATLVALVLPLALPSGTAEADDARCPDNHVCMYEDSDFGGGLYVNVAYDGGKHEIDWWNGDNEISSVINNTGSSIKVYAGDGQSGRWQFANC